MYESVCERESKHYSLFAQDLVNDYTCECGYAYTGAECDDVIDFCEGDPCMNGGSCNVSSTSYLLALPSALWSL